MKKQQHFEKLKEFNKIVYLLICCPDKIIIFTKQIPEVIVNKTANDVCCLCNSWSTHECDLPN